MYKRKYFLLFTVIFVMILSCLYALYYCGVVAEAEGLPATLVHLKASLPVDPAFTKINHGFIKADNEINDILIATANYNYNCTHFIAVTPRGYIHPYYGQLWFPISVPKP